MADPQIEGIFSRVQNQGKLIQIYSSPSKMIRWILLIGIGIISLAGGGISIGFYFSTQIEKFGPAILQKILFGPVVGLILWLVLLGLIAIHLLSQPSQAVGLFEHGIAIFGHHTINPIRWEGVYSLASDIRKDVFIGIPIRYQGSYTIRTWNNQIYPLSHRIQRVDDLAQKIEEAVSPLLMEKIHQSLSEGHLIPFGALQASQEGLFIKKQPFTWTEIEAIEIENGSLKVRKKGMDRKEAARVPVSEVQNLKIILELFDQYRTLPG